MGAEQTFLIAGGRGPAAGSLRHFETAHGQVVHAGTFRVEAGFAHIDFGQVLVGVHVVEVRPDFSGAVRPLPYLRMPLPDGLARIIDGLSDGYPVWPIAKGTRLGGDDRVHTGCLVHGRAVEIHLCRGSSSSRWAVQPVAAQGLGERLKLPNRAFGTLTCQTPGTGLPSISSGRQSVTTSEPLITACSPSATV